ncbi:hypothetical protein L1987_87515 [Smallanthus sonchifolius]|nr:hypothetical protein L1987_87515 [Smallanthus sonchifolius]
MRQFKVREGWYKPVQLSFAYDRDRKGYNSHRTPQISSTFRSNLLNFRNMLIRCFRGKRSKKMAIGFYSPPN